jgi:hypothetical protein
MDQLANDAFVIGQLIALANTPENIEIMIVCSRHEQ